MRLKQRFNISHQKKQNGVGYVASIVKEGRREEGTIYDDDYDGCVTTHLSWTCTASDFRRETGCAGERKEEKWKIGERRIKQGVKVFNAWY